MKKNGYMYVEVLMASFILSIIVVPTLLTFSQSEKNLSYSKKSYIANISAENILEKTKFILKTKDISFLNDKSASKATIEELLEIKNFDKQYYTDNFIYVLNINEINVKNSFVFADNTINELNSYHTMVDYPYITTDKNVFPVKNSIDQSIEIYFDSDFYVIKGQEFISFENNKCNISLKNNSSDVYISLKVLSSFDYSNINIKNDSDFNVYINVFDKNNTNNLDKIKYTGNGILITSIDEEIEDTKNYIIIISVYNKQNLNLIKRLGYII